MTDDILRELAEALDMHGYTAWYEEPTGVVKVQDPADAEAMYNRAQSYALGYNLDVRMTSSTTFQITLV